MSESNTLESGANTNAASSSNVQVPIMLSYLPPRKEDFPPQSRSWRNALNDILSSIEIEQHKDNPIVFFKNEKYVCVYDKVSICLRISILVTNTT